MQLTSPAGRAVSHTALCDAAQIQADPQNRNLNNAVRRLRAQLGIEVARYIQTVRSVGYSLAASGEQRILYALKTIKK